MKIICFSILILISFVAADIPCHCEKSHILGTWLLELNDPIEFNENEWDNLCGHDLPDDYFTSNKGMDDFEATSSVEFDLNSDNSV